LYSDYLFLKSTVCEFFKKEDIMNMKYFFLEIYRINLHQQIFEPAEYYQSLQ